MASRLDKRSPASVARDFMRRINRRDVERLTELMTAHHVLIDSLGARIEGDRQTMRAAWSGYYRMVPDYEIRPTIVVARGRTVLITGTAAGSYVAPTQSKPSGRWHTPAAWRAVVRGGRVAEWQVYADNEPIRALMRGQA